jgi:TonB-dependent SusC/RagA subfamily outer membrane receptor
MKRLSIISVLILIIIFQSDLTLSGQERLIRGVVTAFDSIPLIGATIRVKSTKEVVLSDTMGLFYLWCNNNDRLLVSANGFNSRKVRLDSTVKYVMVNLRLKPGDKNIEHAVGYGHVSDKDKLSSVSSLDDDNMDFSAYKNMYDLINGKFPGVQIINGEIMIRGRTSFLAGNAALIIIDGIQSNESTLFDISPDEVQKISILKDSSAAIYGSRGANGVVLVETKKGKSE